ncbi:hypothetical protein J6590_055509 [Homalodisca vitripennis]|nr:hypothetical protein J6590_055509 [Homalodisca vitripennis]
MDVMCVIVCGVVTQRMPSDDEVSSNAEQDRSSICLCPGKAKSYPTIKDSAHIRKWEDTSHEPRSRWMRATISWACKAT